MRLRLIHHILRSVDPIEASLTFQSAGGGSQQISNLTTFKRFLIVVREIPIFKDAALELEASRLYSTAQDSLVVQNAEAAAINKNAQHVTVGAEVLKKVLDNL